MEGEPVRIGNQADEALLTRYLLGQVEEEERTRVEERFLADEDYFQQLLVVEDELRVAYARGALGPAERERFEERFLIFPDERHKLDLVTATMAELSRMGEEQAAPRAVRRTTVHVLLAAAAVLVVATLVWQTREQLRLRRELSQLQTAQATREQQLERQSQADRAQLEQLNRQLEDERKTRAVLEQELAARRETAPAGRGALAPVLSLFLSPGRLRGEGQARSITVTDRSSDVRLMLDLGNKGPYASYQVTILNSDGVSVWSRAGFTAGRQLLILTIPARLLPQDDYEIDVQGVAAARSVERVGEYYFTVLTK